MSKMGFAFLLLCTLWFMTGCSPIKMPVSNQYQLEAYSALKLSKHEVHRSILVSQPEAMAGYQTEQMLYVKTPFQLSTFANNAWVSSPANMLYPLMIESLQKTGYFTAVASGPFAEKADYRLDTQLIALQQNFLVKPSALILVVKSVLTHIESNRVVASRIFKERIRCPQDTPYGGVIAANQATSAFTKKLSEFVVSEVQKETQRTRPRLGDRYGSHAAQKNSPFWTKQ